MAKIEKKGVFLGKGALVQLLGVACCFFFFPFGVIVGVIAFVAGSFMSTIPICSNCKNRVESASKMCPTCKEQLQ